MNTSVNTLGVLGGMGPLASAAFSSSLYEYATARGQHEQDFPRVVVLSDPTLPDRSAVETAAHVHAFVEQVNGLLFGLESMGATHLMGCCFTLYGLLRQGPLKHRSPFFQLPDFGLQHIRRQRARTLILCTQGARRMRVFEEAHGWSEVAPQTLFPNEADQAIIHRLLYTLKRGGDPADAWTQIVTLARNYDVKHVLCGCTELHLVTRWVRTYGVDTPVTLIDPLDALAANWPEATALEHAWADPR